jgi:hypothetical protein
MQKHRAKQIAEKRNHRPIKVSFKIILLKLSCGVVVCSAKVASQDEWCVISSWDRLQRSVQREQSQSACIVRSYREHIHLMEDTFFLCV